MLISHDCAKQQKTNVFSPWSIGGFTRKWAEMFPCAPVPLKQDQTSPYRCTTGAARLGHDQTLCAHSPCSHSVTFTSGKGGCKLCTNAWNRLSKASWVHGGDGGGGGGGGGGGVSDVTVAEVGCGGGSSCWVFTAAPVILKHLRFCSTYVQP